MIAARIKFSALHLAFSVLMVFAPAAVLFLAWYPREWLPFTGGKQMLALVLLATLIGPLISLLIYKTNRRLLAMDTAVIALIQVVTAAIGIHALQQGRAQWVVFVKDDWRILRPMDMQPGSAMLFDDLLTGPQWAAARYAEDADTRAEQETRELMDGLTIETFISSHVPLTIAQPDIVRSTRPLKQLEDHNSPTEIRAILVDTPEARGWLPLKGISCDGVVLVDAAGVPLKAVLLAPWEQD